MGRYLDKILLPDEQIVHVAQLHWIIFIPGLMLTVLGGIGGFFCYDITYFMFPEDYARLVGRVLAGFSLVVSLIGLILVAGAAVRQSSTELAITNKRLIAKYGFIARATYEIMLNRVTGANFDQTIMGRLLGYGTVLVHGAGGDTSPFYGVSNPQGFHRSLIRTLESGAAK